MYGEKMKYKNETAATVSRLNAVTDELTAINRQLEGLKKHYYGWKCAIAQEHTQIAKQNVMYTTARAYEILAALTEDMAKEINPGKIEKEPF